MDDKDREKLNEFYLKYIHYRLFTVEQAKEKVEEEDLAWFLEKNENKLIERQDLKFLFDNDIKECVVNDREYSRFKRVLLFRHCKTRDVIAMWNGGVKMRVIYKEGDQEPWKVRLQEVGRNVTKFRCRKEKTAIILMIQYMLNSDMYRKDKIKI